MRLFFDFRGSRVDIFWEFTERGGSGVQEGDVVWPRAGILRHVRYSTPLMIPYQSAGARDCTPRPKPNRACTLRSRRCRVPSLDPRVESWEHAQSFSVGVRFFKETATYCPKSIMSMGHSNYYTPHLRCVFHTPSLSSPSTSTLGNSE